MDIFLFSVCQKDHVWGMGEIVLLAFSANRTRDSECSTMLQIVTHNELPHIK